MKALATTFLALASMSGSAEAAFVNVVLQVNDGGPTSPSRDLTDALSVYESLSLGSNSAFADADLREGLLRARGSSDSGGSSFGLGSATMVDTLSFQSWATTTGAPLRLWWKFDGHISPNNGTPVNNEASRAYLNITVNGQNSWTEISNSTCLSPLNPCTIYPTGTVPSIAHTVTGYFEWTSNPGAISFQAGLRAQGMGYSEWADAGNTARFFLEVPPGVTFTSQSGQFLVNAAPVPEPAILSLLFPGLLAIAAVASRQRADRKTAR